MTHARDPREGEQSGGSERPWSVEPERGHHPPPRRPPAAAPLPWVDSPHADEPAGNPIPQQYPPTYGDARTGPPYADTSFAGRAPDPRTLPAYRERPHAAAPPAWSDPPYSTPPAPPPETYWSSRQGGPIRSHRDPAGGDQPPRRRTGRIMAGVLALVLLAGAGVYVTQLVLDDGDGCGDAAALRLAVAPEVSPLIEQAVADTSGGCPAVTLTPLRAGQTATVLAEAGLDGWVPASSAWLHLTATEPPPAGAPPTGSPTAPPTASPAAEPGAATRAPPADSTPPPPTAGSIGSPSAAVSLVRTPLVIAAPQPLAEALGWPDRQPTWAELPGAVVQGQVPRFSMESPLHTPTGLLAVLGVHAAMSGTTPDRGIAQMRALTLRSRLADADADTTALLRELATMSDPDTAIRDVGAFPVTEQALREYQSGRPAIPLAALYPADGLMEVDYPLVLTPAATADPDRRELADQLTARLHSAEFAATVTGHGFRPANPAPANQPAPAATPPAATPQEPAPDRAAPVPTPDPEASAEPGQADQPDNSGLLERYPTPATVPADPALVTAQAHQWAGYEQLAFQTLILVDASASMNDPVRDGDGNATTKAELLRAAGIQASALFGLDTSLGMWMFATPAPTSPPYVEVVPIGPLDEPLDGVPRREVVRVASEGYRPYDRAGTPLYETVLRGVEAMQPLVEPETVTLVVVLTDGRDEDTAYAMSRQDFLSRLGDVQDPDRPVPVFCIGYGADADMAALNDIAEATGGRAVASNDPGDLASAIAQVFLATHGIR
jgi:Ca-activated chloride channel homolog